VVRRDGLAFTPAGRWTTLQAALDDWDAARPALEAEGRALDAGVLPGEPLRLADLHSPLPRAYEWIDGSAFLDHVRRVRKARGATIPPELLTDPLMYQGGSGAFLAPTDPIPCRDRAWGLDFEGEVCVITGDVPMGVTAAAAGAHVKLLCLANDVTLRNLVPPELAKGFGFLQSKPATAFSPFAVTPDELGGAWRDGRVHLAMKVTWNGAVVGDCDAGEMHFSFPELLAHVAKTRQLTAGTLLGSGTVSNADPARGVCCLVERRTLEILDGGEARTRYLEPGDTIEIIVRDGSGRDLFGPIAQEVVAS
jgi:fumarylacetoacetate (FAA) hydrolase